MSKATKAVAQTPVVDAQHPLGVHAAQNTQTTNLYVSVNTYGPDGKQVGTRVVDMYHYGTRTWLQNHLWWAMHHGHSVDTQVANEAEVGDYIKAQELALMDKFSKDAKAA